MTNNKTLICITTCRRSLYLKYILPSYIDFCVKNDDFDFLVALDGNEPDTVDFLKENNIPFLYSEEREGVGLSKNRVLTQLPNYCYYFFIDDDVQIINGDIFNDYIKISKQTGFHHMSCGETKHFHGNIIHKNIDNTRFIFSNWGSGVFNFFTNEGLKKVGGWNTKFAEIRRYGHTEHTYRYYHQDLNPAPFVVSEKHTINYLRFRNPPSVTEKNKAHLNPHTHYNYIEEELIQSKSSFFPLKTLSRFVYCPGNLSQLDNTQTQFNSGVDYITKNTFLTEEEKNNLLKEDYDLLFECYDEYYNYSFHLNENKNHILSSTTYKLGKKIIGIIKKKKIIENNNMKRTC